MTAAICAQFPGCPADEAADVAAWTCQKDSRRVGRPAAAKDFDPQALRLAVVAHIRHEHTDYDERLMRGEVRGESSRVLAEWKRPA